ncbi:MAG: peroxiredoxin [Bacteroidales bacterium]|jgi:peroxiredoxin (alkyl hydroperoxide reductase subunit C)
MKTVRLIALLAILITGQLFAQDNKPEVKQEVRIPLIGETAPSFTAESTNGKITFPNDFYGKWKILFSHPAAFTPVCSSEIIDLADIQPDFEKLDTKIVVVSTDGVNSHLAWKKSMESIRYQDKETPKINFPLVTDNDLEISRKYGMIHSYSSTTRDIRGVFIIDPNEKIRAIFFYPMNVGRNIDEIKRTLIALQTADNKNVLTPANWTPGEDVLIPAPKTEVDADKLAAKKDPTLRELAWYMWLKKIKE